jgi:hypothetical protein
MLRAEDLGQASARRLVDRPRYDVDSVRRGISELSECWKDRLPIDSSFNLAEEYVRGRFAILIEFDLRSGMDINNVQESAGTAFEGAVLPLCFEQAFGADDREASNSSRADDRCYGEVLIRVVQATKNVERFTLPARKSLRRFEKGDNILTGCSYSFTGGFKAPAVSASREFEVAILRSAVVADEVPCHVIEGGSQVVDSIAYYQGKCFGHRIAEADTYGRIPGFVVFANRQGVRVAIGESIESDLKLRDVMIGPFDL